MIYFVMRSLYLWIKRAQASVFIKHQHTHKLSIMESLALDQISQIINTVTISTESFQRCVLTSYFQKNNSYRLETPYED